MDDKVKKKFDIWLENKTSHPLDNERLIDAVIYAAKCGYNQFEMIDLIEDHEKIKIVKDMNVLKLKIETIYQTYIYLINS